MSNYSYMFFFLSINFQVVFFQFFFAFLFILLKYLHLIFINLSVLVCFYNQYVVGDISKRQHYENQMSTVQ